MSEGAAVLEGAATRWRLSCHPTWLRGAFFRLHHLTARCLGVLVCNKHKEVWSVRKWQDTTTRDSMPNSRPYIWILSDVIMGNRNLCTVLWSNIALQLEDSNFDTALDEV